MTRCAHQPACCACGASLLPDGTCPGCGRPEATPPAQGTLAALRALADTQLLDELTRRMEARRDQAGCRAHAELALGGLAVVRRALASMGAEQTRPRPQKAERLQQRQDG